MKVCKNDLVIAKLDDGKVKLFCIKGDTKEGYPAIVEASKLENRRVSVVLPKKSIVVNLGQKKAVLYGTVYGQKIEPLRYSKDLDGWGFIDCYRKMTKIEKKAVNKALAFVWKDLEKHKLTFIAPLTIEVRNKAGKWAGFYKKSDKQEHDLITIGPKDIQFESLVPLLRHEAFHGVYFNGVTDKYKVKWVKLYLEYVKLHVTTSKQLEEARARLEDAGSIKTCLAELKELQGSEDERADDPMSIFRECLGYATSNHNLDKDEINLMLEDGDDLKGIWPRHVFDISEPTVVMTEYAMTKPGEFFAEAGRLYLEGKCPKRVKKLMAKTLAHLVTEN